MNYQNEDGDSALHMAVFWDDVPVANLLVMRGANVDIKNNNGRTTLHMAAWCANTKIAKLLI